MYMFTDLYCKVRAKSKEEKSFQWWVYKFFTLNAYMWFFFFIYAVLFFFNKYF